MMLQLQILVLLQLMKIHIYCINHKTIQHFGKALIDQFYLRYDLLVDGQYWDLSRFQGMEYDQYDTPAATYLVYVDKTGIVRGSVRAVPTDRPYMIKDIWPELIETHLRGWLTAWLAQFNLTIDTIGSWAVHPGGPRILQSVQTALNLPAKALEASHQVLDECGNMSSPTILFILERLRQREAPRPCIALGFGPGLSIEAMLL